MHMLSCNQSDQGSDVANDSCVKRRPTRRDSNPHTYASQAFRIEPAPPAELWSRTEMCWGILFKDYTDYHPAKRDYMVCMFDFR